MSTISEPSLSRTRGTSLHRQLFVVLRERIISGHFAPGSAMPKEEDLCLQFDVSRITVRRALTDLESHGLVDRRQGRRTFVRADLPTPRAAATLSYVDALHKTATETKAEVLSVETTTVPNAVAEQLQLEQGALAVHALRLRKAGGVTLMVSDAWIPEPFGGLVTVAALKKKALYEILMDQGMVFGRVIQEITAIVADPTYARWLNTEVGTPLLRLTRIVHDATRLPVQHLTVTVSPERSRILMDMSIDTMNTLTTGHIVHDDLALSGKVKPRQAAVTTTQGKTRNRARSSSASGKGKRRPVN